MGGRGSTPENVFVYWIIVEWIGYLAQYQILAHNYTPALTTAVSAPTNPETR